MLDVFYTDEDGIFHGFGELIAALAFGGTTFVVGDFFACYGGQVFAADIFVAGFAGCTIYVAAFVAEEFYFVFFFLSEAGELIKSFVQAKLWDYVFEVWAVQFCTEVVKVCKDFCC